MKPGIEIVEDASGHKIVILPDIIFRISGVLTGMLLRNTCRDIWGK